MRSTIAIAGFAVAASAAKTITQTVDVTVISCAPTVTGCADNGGQWGQWGSQPAPASTTPAANTWSTWVESAKPTSTKPATWSEVHSTSKPVSPASTSTWAEWNGNGQNNNGQHGNNGSPAASSTWQTWASTPAAASSTWQTWASTPVAASSTWQTWASTPVAASASCPAYTQTAAPTWLAALPSDVKSSLAAKWSTAVPSDWCYYSYSALPQTVATSTGEWNSWAASSTPVAAASGSPTGTGAWSSWTPDATSKGPIAQYTGAASRNAAAGLAGVAGLAALLL